MDHFDGGPLDEAELQKAALQLVGGEAVVGYVRTGVDARDDPALAKARLAQRNLAPARAGRGAVGHHRRLVVHQETGPRRKGAGAAPGRAANDYQLRARGLRCKPLRRRAGAIVIAEPSVDAQARAARLRAPLAPVAKW